MKSRVLSRVLSSLLKILSVFSMCISAVEGGRIHPIPGSGDAENGDPWRAKQWHLDAMGVDNAWKITRGSRKTIISVVDSGIEYKSPELAHSIARNGNEIESNKIDDDKNSYVDDIIGWDFVRVGNDPRDPNGHGTFLASIISAKPNDGRGGVGICPECSLMPVRFLNWEGFGDTEDAIEGLYYSVKRGAKIINFSFAGEGKDKDLEVAIKYAGKHDVLVIVSASNDHENLDYAATYPARYQFPHMMTVAASNQDGGFSTRSNWGRHSVTLAAPGQDIAGLWFGSWADDGEGTSIAAAVMTGAAGLVRSANPALTAVQVKQIFMKTVKKSKLMTGKSQTDGIVDVDAALQCATDPALPCLKKKK